MSLATYTALDLALDFAHVALIFFNLFGWYWPKTRRLNLLTLALTFFSWIGLGLYYGLGYCPLTDWHWSIKHELGEKGLPASYIKYLIDGLTGYSFSAFWVDVFTAIAFSIALLSSIISNVSDFRKREAAN